ncbi:MAG: Calx-beta domain-containing protein, partial [Steroidobacteraceae bacterium]
MSQAQASVALTVKRTGSDSSAVSVDYSTVDGTASRGSQYTGVVGTLKWSEGDATERLITVPVRDALPFSGTKTFQVRLTDPSDPAVITSPATATVTISGNAGESAGMLEFSSAGYTVAQAAGSLSVTVDRVGGAYGAVSVTYSTQAGTAIQGTNYKDTVGSLHWDSGDATAKTFSVPITAAAGFSGSRLFHVRLLSPTSGASLGTPSNALVTINGQGTNAGSLVFSKSSYAVPQTAGSVTISVDRMDATSGAASVDYATASGSAPAGSVYTGKSGTLKWAAGDHSPKSFAVAVSDATPFTGNKTFTVALSSPSANASIANPGKATVTIAGAAAPAVGSLALSASAYTVNQSSGSITVTVDRTDGSSGAASVAYATSNGSAVAGTNYSGASGTLDWANGDSSPKSFTIPVGTTPFSGNKSFTVTLSAASGATLATPDSALVTIAGDAAAPTPGSLALSAAADAVSQGIGVATVTVTRTGGSSGAASVTYATGNGSAVAGSDYTATSGTLDWASGDSSSKTVTIPILNATPFSGSKTFTVALSGASGATLASPSSATLTITGDAAATTGNLELSAASYAVSQSAGEATVVVQRTGGSSGSVSVAYSTSNGTAVAGSDYTATTGTLNWAAGSSSSQNVQIPISAATPFSGSKSFTITLSSPSTGATLASPSSATVTIAGTGSSGSSGSAPTNVMVIKQGTSSTNAATMFDCGGATAVCPGFSSTYTLYYGNDQTPNLNEIGWQGISGATNYAIYRSTDGGTPALLTTISAATAASNYTGYVSGQSGNSYLSNINSAYTDDNATNVVSDMEYPPVNATASLTYGSNVFTVGKINNNTSVNAPGVITAGQGISGPGIPTGTTIAAFGSGGTTGKGGAGTYQLSQSANATESSQTYGTEYFVNTSYTYYVEAEVNGTWSSPSAYATLPYVVNGEYILSGGVFGGPAEQGAAAPATTPLGYSKALEWSASSAASVIGVYAGNSAADQALNIGGYSYLNVAFYTSNSGINFTIEA